MKNYADMLNDRIKEVREKELEKSPIFAEMKIRELSSKRLDDLRTQVGAILNREPERIWDVFTFNRTGKLLGLIRQIAHAAQHREEILKLVGLDRSDIDMYFKYIGTTPYYDAKHNNIVNGRPMNIAMAKEYVRYIGNKLGLLIEEDDVADYTQENWDMAYNAAMERALNTMNHSPDDLYYENESSFEE